MREYYYFYWVLFKLYSFILPSDRGDCFYPSDEFIARLWIIYTLIKFCYASCWEMSSHSKWHETILNSKAEWKTVGHYKVNCLNLKKKRQTSFNAFWKSFWCLHDWCYFLNYCVNFISSFCKNYLDFTYDAGEGSSKYQNHILVRLFSCLCFKFYPIFFSSFVDSIRKWQSKR